MMKLRRCKGAAKCPRSLILGLLFLFLSLCVTAVFAAVGPFTERVSVSTAGAEGDSGSGSVAISGDGRFVAFQSFAANLVAGDTNGVADVFVRDRQTGTTERVSVSSGGAQGNGFSFDPAISADGRWVAFASTATNLVAGDTNGFTDVFVHDRQTGTTERASLSIFGDQGDGNSFGPSISADGQCVAFTSGATNLLGFGQPAGPLGVGMGPGPGDTNGFCDVFVRDLQAATTERVSVSSTGEEGDDDSQDADISADGRFVAFDSEATNLVSNDVNGANDVFVHDRQTGVTELVSVNCVAGGGANGDSFSPCLSADGQQVAYCSFATDLIPDRKSVV